MGKSLSVEVCEKNVESAGAQPHLPLYREEYLWADMFLVM